ncbi:hypothetical protein QP028_01095 [Corynebacterium suedekumii]|nr:hypothetical protein QP028_01095 [Corynebacterium suedekumii]
MLTDFPVWLRIEHFVNILFITLFIRSGIEILGTLPQAPPVGPLPAGRPVGPVHHQGEAQAQVLPRLR